MGVRQGNRGAVTCELGRHMQLDLDNCSWCTGFMSGWAVSVQPMGLKARGERVKFPLAFSTWVLCMFGAVMVREPIRSHTQHGERLQVVVSRHLHAEMSTNLGEIGLHRPLETLNRECARNQGKTLAHTHICEVSKPFP